MVVAIGAGIVVGGALLFTLAPFVVGDMEMRGASVQETRKEFLSEWGARTESLDVREVKAEYPDLDVPSFLSGALPTEKAVYVECRLRKPDVLIADVVYEAYDMGALDEGLLPSPPSPARFCGGGSLQQRASDAEDVLRTVYR